MPQSLEAEQSTLGAMMMEQDAIAKAASALAADDFYRPIHRKIFNVIGDLFLREIPVDVITVVEELRRRNELEEAGGVAYLMALEQACPSAASIESYAQIVVEKRALRQLLTASEHIRFAVTGDQPEAESILSIARSMLETAGNKLRAGGGRPDTICAADLDQMEFPEPKWIVPGLLPAGLFIFGGKIKMGKSWLAQSLALSVATGGTFLGEVEVNQGEVLYLALEDTFYRLQDRQRKVLQGEPAPGDLYYQIEWPKQGEGGLERIEQWLSLHSRARLVVIDILQKFRPPRSKGGDIYGEDYAALSAMKKIADERGICILVLHHLSKRECDDVVEALSGSVGVAGTADGTWVLERKRADTEATLHISGRDVGDEEKALRWSADVFSWTLLGDAEEIKESVTKQKIRDVLTADGGTLTPAEIAEDADLPVNTVNQTLRRMEKDGEVTRPSRGHYRIPVHYLTGADLVSGADLSQPKED